MTGPSRTELYRGRLITAQAMSASGGAEHRAHVRVSGVHELFRGPFIDYDTVLPTEDEAREYAVRIGMEVVDAREDVRPCRWKPIQGRWGDLPKR